MVAGAYKPDDHYSVIKFDERVIRVGQEVKGASNVPPQSSRGHVGEVAAPRGPADRSPARLIDLETKRDRAAYEFARKNSRQFDYLSGDDRRRHSSLAISDCDSRGR